MATQRMHWEDVTPTCGRIVTEAGHEVARYDWSTGGGVHPHVHPLRHRDGTGVLTNYAPFDHAWHYGLWWSWKLINGIVFWENTELEKQGGYVVAAHQAGADNAGNVTIAETLRLRPHAEPAATWLTETRRLTARPMVPGAEIAGGWALDWDLRWDAQVDCEFDVHPRLSEERWGGYMGLSYRAARALAFDEFLFNSAGENGGEYDMRQMTSCHARPARWAALGGKVDGLVTGAVDTGGVAILAHPGNHATPTPWYAWSAGPEKDSFGFLSPSFLQDEALKLPRGETLALRYRVIPFAGRPTAAALDAAWEAFAQA